MAQAKLHPAYEELVEYLAEKATPQEVLAFQVSDALQQRAEYLTERNKADELTPEEAAELSLMVEFDRLVGVLKAKALRAMKDS